MVHETQWEDMKYVFLQRYQDYCKVNDDIFGMTQGEEESFKEYLERFQYNLQRSKQKQLGKEALKILLLKGIHDESLEILNLMGTGDVFQLPYDDICELCRRYSRGNFKTSKNSSEPSSQYFKSTTKTRDIGFEISNSIEIFKDDIISSLNSQLDILMDKEKWEEPNENVFPRYQKKHLAMDFPLESLIICGICDLIHSTDHCPSLPKIK
jgi:hypothetical protein